MVFLLIFIISCKKKDDNNNSSTLGRIITDIDSNIYHSVAIGTQVWMVENLKVVHYSNGDPIPNVTDNTEWSNLKTGAYCDYNNTPDSSKIYGKLYNFYTVIDSRNICPWGWHVPTDAEWTKLTAFLGGENNAGSKLQETGSVHWHRPSLIEPTNETGFTALPSGFRRWYGPFDYIGDAGFWWSSTENDTCYSWCRFLHTVFVRPSPFNKPYGLSVRCVKD